MALAGLGVLGALLVIIGMGADSALVTAFGAAFAILAVIGLSLRAQMFNRSRFDQIRSNIQVSTRSQTELIRTEIRSSAKATSPAAKVSTAVTAGEGQVTVGSSLGEGTWGVGPEYEYAVRARNLPGAFETFALRSKSLKIRDSLARSATNMAYAYDDLVTILASMRGGLLKGGGALEEVKGWNVRGLLTLARVVANQSALPEDLHNAKLIFGQVKQIWGADTLGKTDRYLYLETLQTLLSFGEAERGLRELGLTRKDPIQARLMQVNRAGADDSLPGDRETRMLTIINDLFARENAAPVAFGDHGDTLLDRLTSTVEAQSVDGPKVSVLMPTYNGSRFLRTALRSMVEQTWRNLEVFVVDDCSDEDEAEAIRQLVEEFPIATLLRQSVNRGAYLARNAGFAASTGDFITVHDDDDWSHPQKIERQVTHLLENPNEIANLTQHSRSTEDLWFLRINNNPAFAQPNFSSLMVRRSVFDEVGPWDEVNRGADAEFRDRLVRHYGEKITIVGEVPLSFTRTRQGSLTDGELGRGYIDPSRLFYVASYTRAHIAAAGREGDGSWQLDDFARPLNMMPELRGKALGTFDVVFATDFRFPGGTTSLAIQEIRAAVGAGLRVGVMQLDSPLNAGPRAKISDKLLGLVVELGVSILSLKDNAQVRLLIVRHPSVVQFLDQARCAMQIEELYLVINTAPVLNGGGGSGYSLVECRETLTRLTGVSPLLVPESGVTRRLCLQFVPSTSLASFDWPGFVEVQDFTASGSDFTGKPVVGRHSRDNIEKWPDTRKAFELAYDRPDTFTTRILGGAKSIARMVPSATWSRVEVLEFGAQEPAEYLRGIDFWVYAHSAKLTESFGMAAIEAMASGLVVILPPYMERTFGDAAIYAEPAAIEGLVDRYWSDPELYRQQASIARERAESLFSSAAYVSRLQTRLGLINATAE